jgi:hypothetical protein
MDMDNAAMFLSWSILTMLGLICIVVGLVVINHIMHQYWKPVRIFTPDSWSGFNPPERFVQESQVHGKIEPEIEKTTVVRVADTK